MTIDIAAISAIIQQYAPKAVEECFTSESRGLARIPRAPMSNNGLPPTWEVWTAEGHGAAGTHAEGGPYTAASESTRARPAMTDWARMSEAISFTEQALLMHQAAGSAEFIAAYVQEQMRLTWGAMARKAWAFLMSNDPEGGGNANAPSGIDAAIAVANTYAGINRGANAYWVPSGVDGLGGALNETMMTTVYDSIVARGGMVDEIWTPLAEARTIRSFATAVTPTQVITGPAPVTNIVGNSPGIDPWASPVCYWNALPVFGVPGHTGTITHFVRLNADDGWAIEELQPPTWSDLEKVQNQPVYTAYCTWHFQARYRNPYKNGGVVYNHT